MLWLNFQWYTCICIRYQTGKQEWFYCARFLVYAYMVVSFDGVPVLRCWQHKEVGSVDQICEEYPVSNSRKQVSKISIHFTLKIRQRAQNKSAPKSKYTLCEHPRTRAISNWTNVKILNQLSSTINVYCAFISLL